MHVIKGRQYNSACTVQMPRPRAQLQRCQKLSLRTILSCDSDKSGCFNHGDELNSIVQIGCDVRIELSMHTIIYTMCMLYIVLYLTSTQKSHGVTTAALVTWTHRQTAHAPYCIILVRSE